MANNKVTLTTPLATAVYPRLNEPDYKFDPSGTFSVTARVSAEEGQGLKDELDKMLDQHHQTLIKERRKPNLKRADLTVKPAYDDDGNETGELDFKFTMKPNVTTQTGKSWVQRPKLYDSQMQGFNGPVIGGGSKIVVNFTPAPYYTAALGAGLKLRLNAVQIVELEEYKKAGDVESLGFAKHDNGFVATEESKSSSSTPPAEEEPKPEVATAAPAASFEDDEL